MGALAGFLVSEVSLSQTLTRISEVTVEALHAVAFAGMTLLDDGRPTTAVFTSEESPEIDSAQYESGHGPCLDAWRQNRTVGVEDTTAPGPYPDFCAASLQHGIHSTLSLPIGRDGDSFGALNLYAPTERAFSDDDQALALDLAGTASALIVNSQAYWGSFELTQQLQEAMASRSVIDQAKGMLMVNQPGLNADEAFDMLKRASQRENVKLRDIAGRVVANRNL